MMNPSARACGAGETKPHRISKTEKASSRFMLGWTEAEVKCSPGLDLTRAG